MLVNVPGTFLVTGSTEAIAAEGDTDGQMVPPDSEISGSMRLFQATKLCILYLSFYMNYPHTGMYHMPASFYTVEEKHHVTIWILYKHKGKPRLSMGSKINSRKI